MDESLDLFFQAQMATTVDTEKNTAVAITEPASAALPKLFELIMQTSRIATVVFFVTIFLPLVLFADVSNDIPLENPIYNNIERLSNLNVFKNDIQSFRPITLDHLKQMVDLVDDGSSYPLVIQRDLEAVRAFLRTQYKKNEIQASAGIEFLKTNAVPVPILQTDSFSNPLLNTKDQGRYQFQSDSLRFSPRVEFNWGGWAAFQIQPTFSIQEDVSTHVSEGKADLQTTQLKVGHGDLELSAGRIPIAWGQGISGSLTYGGSQVPLDMVMLKNSSPVRLPWILKLFGPTQFTIFVAQLDANQVLGENFIIGERAAIRPASFLEMGFTQSIQMSGHGAPSLSLGDAISEIIGIRLQDIHSVNLTNRNFSADFSLKIPPLKYTTLYAEMYFEDCCEYTFGRDSSKLFGIKFPELWKAAGALSFEYVLTTEIYGRQDLYTSGFINRGYPLQHMLGPDADGFYMNYHHVISKDLEMDLVNAYENRGRTGLDRRSRDIRLTFPDFEKSEQRIRSTVKFQKQWTSHWWSTFQTGYERIWNFEYTADVEKSNYLVRVENSFSF